MNRSFKFRELSLLSNRINKSNRFFADLLFVLFIFLTCISYDYRENLSPKNFLSMSQVFCLWFIFPFILSLKKNILKYFLFLFLLWGGAEALLGVLQLYNVIPSKNLLFKITGSFFNPGPYGGLIAMIIPLNLWLLLSEKKSKKLYLFYLCVFFLCISILPATLSRSAWLSALFGIIFVCFFYSKKEIIYFIKKEKVKSLFSMLFFSSLLITGIMYSYNIKKGSADGRFFIWKITSLAIADYSSPIVGSGIGSFSKNYSDAQIKYFSQGDRSEKEKRLADTPEYAFNEYLRFFLELGFLGGVVFLLLSVVILKISVKNQQIGAGGSFLSLSVFAFSSYPYYLFEFLFSWVFLSSVCLYSYNGFCLKKINFKIYFLFLVLITFTMLQIRYKIIEKQWQNISSNFNLKNYNYVVEKYVKLYPSLNYNPKFVFEYAVALNRIKKYQESNKIIARGIEISTDPMFYNLKGKNLLELKKFHESEKALLNSTYLVPNRIYPYYLLSKLYSSDSFYNEKKLIWATSKVLFNPPKVHSPAIEEMRENALNILIKNNLNENIKK